MGRDVLLVGSPAASWTEPAEWLRRAGAGRILVIGSTRGTGRLPPPEWFSWTQIDGRGSADPTSEARRVSAAIGSLSPRILSEVDAFDPANRALVLAAPFLAHAEVAGRPVRGASRRLWRSLEDKTLAPGIFDQADVLRLPSHVVPPNLDALRAATRALEGGRGVVVSADASGGVNGGGSMVLRCSAASEESIRVARNIFAGRCRRVRVSPYVEGVPCSIHGLVVDRAVAVFLPVQMIMHETAERFRLMGFSTEWDPGASATSQLQGLARRIGQWLSSAADYRGAFGIDAIWDGTRFFAIEVNTRFTSALAAVDRVTADSIPLRLINHLVIEDPGAVDVRTVEEEVRNLMRSRAFTRGWIAVPVAVQARRWLVRTATEAGGEVVGAAESGSGASGGFVNVQLAPGSVRSAAETASALRAALLAAETHVIDP